MTKSECAFCSLWCPAYNAHVPYCHLWSVPLYSVFPLYLTKGKIFFKLDKKCIFWFSLQRLTETFLLLGRTEKDMVKIYIGLHVKYMLFLSYCNETFIFCTDSRKILKYQHSWKYIQLHMSFSIRTVRQTDMMGLTIIFDILLTHVIKMEVDETSFVWYGTSKLTITVCSVRNVMLLKCVFELFLSVCMITKLNSLKRFWKTW